MSGVDRLTATLLLPLARGVDFIAACIRLAAELAEPGCPPCLIGTGFDWQKPIDRAWLLAPFQEPGGFLLH
jgi:hypothetical protein